MWQVSFVICARGLEIIHTHLNNSRVIVVSNMLLSLLICACCQSILRLVNLNLKLKLKLKLELKRKRTRKVKIK